jgi:hypothetical protein
LTLWVKRQTLLLEDNSWGAHTSIPTHNLYSVASHKECFNYFKGRKHEISFTDRCLVPNL